MEEKCLVLEIEDLITYEADLSTIFVDKQVFDDYEEDTVIGIKFVGDDEICDYIMINETEDSIEMYRLYE